VVSKNKNFKRKTLVKLTMLINAYILLNYIPNALKTAEIIMIPKPGNKLSEVESSVNLITANHVKAM
jgi:hypothetical protein